ncbi:MAG: hypothetical protein KA243_02275 [Candidatus Aminicenantes bacterium]|nr:hypothetical protein [Candidatus Aminicenantes bacterium]
MKFIDEIETTPDFVLNEAKAKTGTVHFRARALKLDVPTSNGRVYKKALIEREIGRLMKSPTSVFGAAYHPEKAAEVPDVSHLITGLEVGRDGYLWAEGEILDTTKGRDLKAIIGAGGKVGLSLRGTGKVNEKGEIDEATYKLHSIDAVLRPASEGASLSAENVFESVELDQPGDPGAEVDEEQELCAAIHEKLEAELAKTGRLRQLIEKQLAGVRIEAVELVEERVEEAKKAVQFVLNEAVRSRIVESIDDAEPGGIGITPNPGDEDKRARIGKRLVQEARLAGSTLPQEKILEAVAKR